MGRSYTAMVSKIKHVCCKKKDFKAKLNEYMAVHIQQINITRLGNIIAATNMPLMEDHGVSV